MTEQWENSGDYDKLQLSGLTFYTATVNDQDGNPVALVYGRTKEECRDRTEAVARVPKMQEVIRKLIIWDGQLGGWDAPIWEEAREVVR
jgi:hypothetical protein